MSSLLFLIHVLFHPRAHTVRINCLWRYCRIWGVTSMRSDGWLGFFIPGSCRSFRSFLWSALSCFDDSDFAVSPKYSSSLGNMTHDVSTLPLCLVPRGLSGCPKAVAGLARISMRERVWERAKRSKAKKTYVAGAGHGTGSTSSGDSPLDRP